MSYTAEEESAPPTTVDEVKHLVRTEFMAAATPDGQPTMGTILLYVIAGACIGYAVFPANIIGIVALLIVALRWVHR